MIHLRTSELPSTPVIFNWFFLRLQYYKFWHDSDTITEINHVRWFPARASILRNPKKRINISTITTKYSNPHGIEVVVQINGLTLIMNGGIISKFLTSVARFSWIITIYCKFLYTKPRNVKLRNDILSLIQKTEWRKNIIYEMPTGRIEF